MTTSKQRVPGVFQVEQVSSDPNEIYYILYLSSNQFTIDYKGRRHIYIYSSLAMTLQSNDFGGVFIQSGQWFNMDFPVGTKFTAPLLTNPLPVVVRCTDDVLPSQFVTPSGLAKVVFNQSNKSQAAFSQQFACGAVLLLDVDFNVTALNGGTAPTVTFQVFRIGADLVKYGPIWNPTAISAPGQLSTSIGPGLATNADPGNLIEVDMVTTGAPTSITFSGSIIGKH